MITEPNKELSGVPFALYDAFTSVPYSGSQAGIVLNASDIAAPDRMRIAREIGAPATAFVDHIGADRIKVQFFSTVMELPMCGHGTLCLITRLVDTGLLRALDDHLQTITLDLPGGPASVDYHRDQVGRIQVMLDVAVARFEPADLDLSELAGLLGIARSDIATDWPIEVAKGDFVHLCLPMCDLPAMRALSPEFTGLAAFCRANGVETVAAFSTETCSPDRHLHVRDFCPAVGVAESAAAGTTNAALAAYALRHGIVERTADGTAIIRAEQGIELGRPSQIISRIEGAGGAISRLQVGGVATQVLDGTLSTAFAGLS